MTGVERVARAARQHSLHLLHRKGRAGATEGSHRRPFHVGPVTATPAGKGNRRVPRERRRSDNRLGNGRTEDPRKTGTAWVAGDAGITGAGVTRLAASARTLRAGGVRFVPLAGERAGIVVLTRPGPVSPAVISSRAAWQRGAKQVAGLAAQMIEAGLGRKIRHDVSFTGPRSARQAWPGRSP